MDNLVATAVQGVKKLDPSVLAHENVRQFLGTHWREWLFTCGELAICQMPDGSALEEPTHQGGGASVLHMSVTLFGQRRLRAEQGPDLPGSCVIATHPVE